jgi:catechol 2,3-dioxygenase-like lactoylglutathione lyase family enzyme
MALRTGGLHHLAIRVTDLGRARRFYVGALGFRPVLERPGRLIVDADGTLLDIRGATAETAAGDRFDPFRVGLDHLALGVRSAAELAGLKGQLDAAGVSNNGVERDEVVGAEYISFYDPDGIAWELYAMPTA